jgi:glyoxylase-like metal-dependent hydrolase (beta-lactamase superfamily II)
MKLDSFIHYMKVDLMPGVPLYVYAIKGHDYSILIDTGIKAMKTKVIELCKEAGPVKIVLITHAHADHIGCNKTVKEMTGAHFFAAGALTWIEDLEKHYLEFCIPNEHLLDSPQQREEIMGLMDGAIHVDAVLSEGIIFRPSQEIELTTLAFPAHKLEEIGFLEKKSGTLFMGDVLLAVAAPFFHGFQTARGFRNTLNKIETMIEEGSINRILSAHHPPLEKEDAEKEIRNTMHFLNEIEEATISAANNVEFHVLWKDVCNKLNRQQEFRGYAMLEVQVQELIEDKKLGKENGKIFRI